MVYDGILLGLIVGLFRGGYRYGLHQFATLQLRGGWIFPLLLLAQFLIFSCREDWIGLHPSMGTSLRRCTSQALHFCG